MVLEKTLESTLDCTEIQAVHPKGDGCSLEELMLLNLVLEKNVASPLDSKEIKPANPKGNQL